MFSDVLRMLSGAHVCSLDVLSYVCSKCVQRFSDVHRYSQIFCGYSKDDLRMFSEFFMMFSGCSHNILRVLWWIWRVWWVWWVCWVLQAWWAWWVWWVRWDFDNPKVYGDTSISDGLVCCYFVVSSCKVQSCICVDSMQIRGSDIG